MLSRFYPPNLLNQDRTRKEHSQSTEPRSNQLAEPRPTQPIEPNTNERDDDDNYLANPEPQNEHVGVDDDEDLYLPAPKGVGEENLSAPKGVGQERKVTPSLILFLMRSIVYKKYIGRIEQ